MPNPCHRNSLDNFLAYEKLDEFAKNITFHPSLLVRVNASTLTSGQACELQSHAVVPPYLGLCCPWFQLPLVNHGLEADDHQNQMTHQKVSSHIRLHHNVYITHFMSPHRHFIISYHLKNGKGE